MNNKGFALIEIMLGLSLLGIIAAIFLPLINTTLGNINKANERIHMVLLAESIMEQMKYFKFDSYQDAYIFDVNIVDLMNWLSNSDDVNINLPENKEGQEFSYTCDIYKSSINDKLWHIKIAVNYNREKKVENVVLQSIIENPNIKGQK